jgi:hypothetical protein
MCILFEFFTLGLNAYLIYIIIITTYYYYYSLLLLFYSKLFGLLILHNSIWVSYHFHTIKFETKWKQLSNAKMALLGCMAI